MALNSLGLLYYSNNAHTKAQSAYEEALEIYRTLARTNPDAYIIDVANTLIMGVIFLKQPAAQLSEAKNLLQDFDHIPRVQRLLEVIDKELGK
jgi:tetratricopeptide (TPR) repeat protein